MLNTPLFVTPFALMIFLHFKFYVGGLFFLNNRRCTVRVLVVVVVDDYLFRMRAALYILLQCLGLSSKIVPGPTFNSYRQGADPILSGAVLSARPPKPTRSKTGSCRRRTQKRVVAAWRTPAVNAPTWRPNLWLQLVRRWKYGRDKKGRRHLFPYSRARTARWSNRLQMRAQTTLVRMFTWICTVVALPRIYSYTTRFLRWPFILIGVLVLLPVLVHAFLWFVQDYELSFRNLFVHYKEARVDVSFMDKRVWERWGPVAHFLAVVFRMYLNGLWRFYFEAELFKFEIGSIPTFYLWLHPRAWGFLLFSAAIVQFLHDQSAYSWARMRWFRKYSKKEARELFFKRYYGLVVRRLHDLIDRPPSTVHPDKGRTDYFPPFIIGLPIVWPAGSEDQFTQWLAFWFLNVWFNWTPYLVAFFVLFNLTGYGVARIFSAIVGRVRYQQPLPFFSLLRNLFAASLFGYMLYVLQAVWMPKHAPFGGISNFVVAVAVQISTSYWAVLFVTVFLSIPAWFLTGIIRTARQHHYSAARAKTINVSRRVKQRAANRRAIEDFTGRIIVSAKVDRNIIYAPVLRKPRRLRDWDSEA